MTKYVHCRSRKFNSSMMLPSMTSWTLAAIDRGSNPSFEHCTPNPTQTPSCDSKAYRHLQSFHHTNTRVPKTLNLPSPQKQSLVTSTSFRRASPQQRQPPHPATHHLPITLYDPIQLRPPHLPPKWPPIPRTPPPTRPQHPTSTPPSPS